ncbi:MAG: ABC transporter substrate-binding protein, partial [Gemmatimonadota bacterium]
AGDWTFRVCPTDLQHGPALASWAVDRLGGTRLGVLYANDAYGRGVLESFRAAARETTGAEVVTADPYHPAMIDSEEALDPFLERAMARGMDVLMIAGQADEALVALRAARRLGFNGPVIGADGLTNIAQAGEVAEGVYVSSAFLPDSPRPDARSFVEAYRERYDELPDHRGAMTYDAIRLVADAIRDVGTDRDRIRDYVADVGDARDAFDGVSGEIAFDANGDVTGKPIAIGVVRDGQLVTAGS